MKYHSTLPLLALIVVSTLGLLTYWSIIPPGITLLNQLVSALEDYWFGVLLFCILVESIIFLGFYFPGQFIAVLLVITHQGQNPDLVQLSVAMVIASTLGSAINYLIGSWRSRGENSNRLTEAWQPKLKHLLLAMIHMNSLAFFMHSLGVHRAGFRWVALGAVLNLPYYFVIVVATLAFSEELVAMAENGWVLATAVLVWLLWALRKDYTAHKAQRQNLELVNVVSE